MSVDNYYDKIRPELICQIPTKARRILDVGCASGETGAYLKKQRGGDIEVVGIEYSDTIGTIARTKLDRVFIGNVEEINLPYGEGYFDCIVYGDVLEHLVDPWKVVRDHARLLNDEGCIVASIPNIAYYKVISMLKKGLWRYEDAGIMDKTHLRFFTYQTIIELFQQADLQATMVDRIIGGPKITRLLPRTYPNRFVQQYIIYATKNKV